MTGPATMRDKPYEVTQIDRDACADLLKALGYNGYTLKGIRLGKSDKSSGVQAFARHRSELDARLHAISVLVNSGAIEGLTTEAVEALGRADMGSDCAHNWLPGAEGAFAGLTEHCGRCGCER